MLGLKLNHVSNRAPCHLHLKPMFCDDYPFINNLLPNSIYSFCHTEISIEDTLDPCLWLFFLKWQLYYAKSIKVCSLVFKRKRSAYVQVLALRRKDDVNKWKHFPCYWPFVWGIHRSRVNSPDKGQWRGALMFSLICAWIIGWENNREAGDLRSQCAHYKVTAMAWYAEV